MKRVVVLLVTCMSVVMLFAQSAARADARTAVQTTVIKMDGSTQSVWFKADNDPSAASNATMSGTENVSFSSTAEGVFVNILNGSNKIKLLSLTGQSLFNGELSQGRFFIQSRKGIYFLKINGKSFKVICK